MPGRFIQLLILRRWIVLVSLAVVTLLAAASIPRISFDNSIEAWFLEDDPSLAIYDKFTETFKADQIVVVGIFAGDIFDREILHVVDRVSSEAAKLEFVDRVRSITNSTVVRRIGGIAAPDFREQILASPLQRESLLTSDLDATAIVIYYSRDGNTFRQKGEFVNGLRAIVSDATRDVSVDYAITGGPVLGVAAQNRNSDDMKKLVPAMILVIVAIAYGVFRRVSLTLLPLGVVSVAVLWAYGLMGVAEWRMTMISIILIPLILSVGVAHSIHVIAQYRLDLRRGLAHEEALNSTIARLLKPCFFASITTVVGLLSLLVSDLEPVREFAIIAAVGVFSAFVISMTFLPIMLLMIPPADSSKSAFDGDAVTRLLVWMHEFGLAGSGRILLLALATGVAFIWLATRVEAGLDPMSWIRKDDPIRIDTERIDNTFGGGLSLEFLLSSPDGRLKEPAVLRRMDEFQAWLVANTTVGRAISVADLVKEATRVARDEGSSGFSLPRSTVLTNAMLKGLQREGELSPWITSDYSAARISARMPLSSVQEIVAEIPEIQQRIADTFRDSGVTAQMTGHAVLSGLMQTHMIDSQLRSFSVALVVVSLMMILLLRSVVLGLLAMVPNLLPIVIGLGAMTLFSIALNPATVMVAAVALGIVVDDTIHLMTAFERGMRRTGAITGVIRPTLLEVGRPVVITTVLLATGFAILILGSFLPSRQIGGLIALIVVAALVTDLLFLPAILRLLPAGVVRKFLRTEI